MTSKLNHGYDPRVMIVFLHACMHAIFMQYMCKELHLGFGISRF